MNLLKHLSHYTVLLGIILVSFFGLILFSYDKIFQVAISFALALSYITWGLVHHYLNKDLHVETFIEYLVVAILGFVILFTMVIRT